MSTPLNARIKIKHDTTENWNNISNFIPLEGEIIVYDDYQTRTVKKIVNDEIVEVEQKIPGVKIGTGNAYVQDLAFIDDDMRSALAAHINNADAHVSLEEKLFWNSKINIDDSYDKQYSKLENEILIFNRN